MTRWWDEHAGTVIDQFGFGLLLLIAFAAALLIGAGWRWWPKWLPRASWFRRLRGLRIRARWPRWRWPAWLRFRRRKRSPAKEETVLPVEPVEAADVLPDLPTEVFMSLADRLAAEGRFAEAVRERLRGVVRELVDARVMTHQPEWTVTELARAAATARPGLGAPLSGATGTFSEIWYGQRPALAADDTAMRGYAATVHEALVAVPFAGALR